MTEQYIYFLRPSRESFLRDITDEEQAKVGEHFAYLQRLLGDGRLILAGRTEEDEPVGLVIFEAVHAEEARKLMENDPAVQAGVFTARLAASRVAMRRSP